MYEYTNLITQDKCFKHAKKLTFLSPLQRNNLFAQKLHELILYQPTSSTWLRLVKMYADKYSHVFWECLAEDTSVGIWNILHFASQLLQTYCLELTRCSMIACQLLYQICHSDLHPSFKLDVGVVRMLNRLGEF